VSSDAVSFIDEDKPAVYFAGIAYLGQYNLLQQNYPYALALNQADKNGQGQLDIRFHQMVKASQPQHMRIEFGLANTRKSQSVVMALAIEREAVSTEIIGKNRKIIAEINAQLFFFDFDSMSLIGNFPLSMAKNHIVPAGQDFTAEILPLFSDLYLGVAKEIDAGKNMLALAIKKLEQVSPGPSQGVRFQLEQVSLSARVKPLLPDNLSTQRFNQFIGQYFSARLASRYDVTVLPFTKGYAIGNQMAGRFSNGTVFNIVIPEPDYVFSIAVTSLKKAPLNKNLMYAARIKFNLTEKNQQRLYIDGHFQKAIPKLVMNTQNEIDDWSAYHDAIEMLIDDLITQLGKPKKQWFNTHAKDNKSYKGFAEKKELFKQ
jgi:hypothetical protein